MLSDKELLQKARERIEEKLGWGPSSLWTNQDFISLAHKIQQETGLPISHVTLKRLWGKVKYEGLPQTNTYNTLVQYLGFSSWRDFSSKQIDSASNELVLEVRKQTKNKRIGRRPLIMGIAFILLPSAIIALFIFSQKKKVHPENYLFSARVIHPGKIPASVEFRYGTRNAEEDSMVIQQSWDSSLRATVSSAQQEHTLIYYYPGYFTSKLLARGQVVKEQGLLVSCTGWVAAIMHRPIPIYFDQKEIIHDGRLFVTKEQVEAQNVALKPDAPQLSYVHVQDFGEIYSDNFNFETSVRNEYAEGSSICQLTDIYLLCQGKAVHVPLCAKGCESSISMFFTDFIVSGKQKNLSSFAVDFQNDARVKIIAHSGKAAIYINDQLALSIDHEIIKSKIIGIDFIFQGTGSVDYVRLSNDRVHYNEEFDH